MQKRPQTWQTTWAGGRGSSTRCGGGLVWFCTDCSSPSPASARSGVTRPGLRYLQSRKEWSSAGRMNCPPPSPASTRTGVTRTVLRRFQHPQGLEFDKANGLFVAISSIRKDWSFTDCPLPSPTSARIGVRQSARIVRRYLQHPQGLEFLTDCPSLSPASARIGVRQSAWAVGRHLQHPQGLEVHGLPFAISSIRKDWSSVKRTDCSSPSPASARSGVSNRLSLAISSIRKDWCSANARAARPSPSPTSARSGGRQSERTVRRHLQHPQRVEFHGLSFAISSIRKDWCTAKRTGCSSPSYPLRLHYWILVTSLLSNNYTLETMSNNCLSKFLFLFPIISWITAFRHSFFSCNLLIFEKRIFFAFEGLLGGCCDRIFKKLSARKCPKIGFLSVF